MSEVEFTSNLLVRSKVEFTSNSLEKTEVKFTFRIGDTDGTIVNFLEKTITEINGVRTKSAISDFIRYEFLASDAKKFRNYVSDNTPGLDMDYEFEGEDGSTFISGFPIGTDFFWF